MSKLVEVVQLLKKRLNPELVVTGIVPCLYDSRLRLAREVLGEIRTYFRGQVFPHPVRANVKLAEAPSFGQTVFEYAPDSNGADDYMRVAREVIARESRDTALGALPPFDERARLPLKEVTPARNPPPRPPPRKPALKDAATKDAATKDTAAKETAAKETAAKEMAAKHAGPQVTEPKASKSGSAPSNGTAAASAVSKPAETRAKMPTPKTPSTTNRAPDVERSTTADSPQPTASVRATPSSPREVSARAEHDTIVPRAPVARPQARPEPRVLRAEDVPPLPPDAFEILSILPTDT
jgi:hypothetical protein